MYMYIYRKSANGLENKSEPAKRRESVRAHTPGASTHSCKPRKKALYIQIHSTLQHTATHCNTLQHNRALYIWICMALFRTGKC